MNSSGPGKSTLGTGEEVILDACCLLNLAATDRLAQLLAGPPYSFAIGRRACREALWLRTAEPDVRTPVDLGPCLESGLLAERVLTAPEELALFVEFAAQLDDGEAEAAAIAVARGAALATDDRKVRRVVAERHGSIRLISTLELMHEWQARCAIPDAEVAELLRRIAFHATYRPRRTDPLYDWWRRLVPEL